MADNEITPMKVNHTANVKAPLTPIAWLADGLLSWNPVEYSDDHYVILRDGIRIADTYQTSFRVTEPGEYQVIVVNSDGVESFASEPRSLFGTIVLEMPEESTTFKSSEITYEPTSPIAGYHGAGFVEIDHTTAPLEMNVTVPADGVYAVSLIYANGNGPVYTENKCAVRTLVVDGKPAGALIMPQRGEGKWSDWGRSSLLRIPLTAGNHKLSIEMRPANENMNLKTNHALIDRMEVSKIK